MLTWLGQEGLDCGQTLFWCVCEGDSGWEWHLNWETGMTDRPPWWWGGPSQSFEDANRTKRLALQWVTGHFRLPGCLMLGHGLSLPTDAGSSSSWVSRLLHLNWKYTSALLSPQHADCRPWDLSTSIITGAIPYDKSLLILYTPMLLVLFLWKTLIHLPP